MNRTVIIDGDILVYRASEAATENIQVEQLEETEVFLYREVQYGDKQRAKKALDTMIEKICTKTKSDKCVICLSDSQHNFRKDINPDYKGNRKKVLKPVIYQYLRDYFKQEGYKVYQKPSLEADDVIGILATHPTLIKGDKCVWSFDKDFKTIPCKFAQGSPDGSLTKKTISQEEADWWFMYQTLIGDKTDGYAGCYKIGDKYARKILGEIGKSTLEEMWKKVLETYKSKGLTEEEALLNARMARILRAEDYDFKQKEVRLWQGKEPHTSSS